MWGHCVWRHLLTGCNPAAPSGTAPQSMRREQLCFMFGHLDFDSDVIFDGLCGLWIMALTGFAPCYRNKYTCLSLCLVLLLSKDLVIYDIRAVNVCFSGKNVSMISYCCLSFSWSICAPGGVVYKAWPGPERGEWPQGGVGRSPPAGAQHFQRRCSCITTWGSREEEDFKCCGGEEVD